MSPENLENKNRLNRPAEPHGPERKEDHSEEVDKLKVGSAVGEEVALTEGEIETTGRVSEVLGENVSENQSGTAGGVKRDTAAPSREQRIENLLKTAPPPNLMRQEIKKTLSKEYGQLSKQVGAAQKNGNFFEMTRLVARMRQIKDTLAKLVRAPIKLIRELWLKIVHGEQL